MNNFYLALNDLKEEIMLQDCVKEYFSLKKELNNNKDFNELEIDLTIQQRKICSNKENEEIFSKEKEKYNKLKEKAENNPFLTNFNIVKEEVFSLLLDIKDILG